MASKIVSKLNSYSLLLNSNETFYGLIEDVTSYESITISINSDESSAVDGIKIYSGATPDSLYLINEYTYNANDNRVISFNSNYSFFKIVYINGATNQTSFHLQTFFSKSAGANITVPTPLDVTITDQPIKMINDTGTSLSVTIADQPIKMINDTGTSLSVTIADQPIKMINDTGTSLSVTITDQPIKIINDDNTSIMTTFESRLMDLFGNLKVSSSYTLLDITHLYDKNPLMMDELISGTVTATSTYTTASILMSVGANTDKVIRQSRLYSSYQPGKSLCIRMTGVINANSNGANTTSRLGYFDKNNGLYFEYSNGIYNIVKRNATSEIRIAQSSWDDALNGTGPSGITVDFTKNMIYYIEFAYLGVGHIKMGVIYDGVLYVAYTFRNINLTYPYMITPNLPMRWELSSSGGSGKLICTCGSVQSEGGYSLIGNPFAYGMTTAFQIDNGQTNMQYVMSIRLKANERKLVKLIALSIICTSGSNAIYSLYKVKSPATIPISKNGSVSPAPPNVSYTSITNSSIEYHHNTSTVSGTPASNYLFDSSNADLLYINYFTSTDSLNLSNLTNIGGPIYISAGIDDVAFYSDYLVLTVQQLSNQDESYYGAMNWIEV